VRRRIMARQPPHRPSAGAGGQPPPSFSSFVLRLLGYLFVVSLAFSLGGLHLRLGPVQKAMAAAVTTGANALGAGAERHGTLIRLGGAALDINHECTGVFVLIVYATFVLAYPAPWSQRASGIALGLSVLTAVNVGRLIALTVIASRRPTWFAYFHEYFFQGLFIALLAFLASVWTEQVRRATLRGISA
jgi:exosortase/archaeosortase family protein